MGEALRVIALTFLLLAANACALLWLTTRAGISRVLLFSLALYFVFWLVTPVITTYVFWDQVRTWLPTSAELFYSQAAVECAAFLVALLVFSVTRHTFRTLRMARLSYWTVPRRAYTPVLLGAIAAELMIDRAMAAIVGSSYIEANEFAVVAGNAALGQLAILALLDAFLVAFLVAAMLQPRATYGRPRWLTLLLIGWLIENSVTQVLAGGRFRLILPCIVLMLYIHSANVSRKAVFLTYAGVAAFLMTLGAAAAIVIGGTRQTQTLDVRGAAESSEALMHTPLLDRANALMTELNMKFDSISTAAVLTQVSPGPTGWEPYVGAALALVPRTIYPSKPTPGSIGDGYAGTPQRIAAAAMGYGAAGNVGISPAATEHWHFGWIGIAVLVVANVLQWRLMNSLLLAPSLVAQTMGVFLLGLPSVSALFVSGDVVLMTSERVIAIFVTLNVLLALTRRVPSRPASVSLRAAAH